MSIKSRLILITFSLTLNVSAGHHAAYAENIKSFDGWGDLEMFQSRSQMRAIAPEADDVMREELKNDALAEEEARKIDVADGPEIYLSDERLNDEILAANLAGRIHFNYEKAEAALATSHVSETWWNKFLDFIRWDKILGFMEKHAEHAEQWEQVYLK